MKLQDDPCDFLFHDYVVFVGNSVTLLSLTSLKISTKKACYIPQVMRETNFHIETKVKVFMYLRSLKLSHTDCMRKKKIAIFKTKL